MSVDIRPVEPDELHFCESPELFPVEKFLQLGKGNGKKVMVVGESPALNGWVKSGRAFYTIDGKLLASGRNLNRLLSLMGLSIEECGFTELVKCCVGKNRKLLSKCAPKWKDVFNRQLSLVAPELLVILGVETLRIFNLMYATKLQTGCFEKVELLGKDLMVLPIYHPSPIAPNNHIRNEHIFERYEKELLGVIG
jgi:uracil-DNA glycosylase family 4